MFKREINILKIIIALLITIIDIVRQLVALLMDFNDQSGNSANGRY
jgi:hypothetical protein